MNEAVMSKQPDHERDNQILHAFIALAQRLNDIPLNEAKDCLRTTVKRIDQVSQRIEPLPSTDASSKG